MRSQPSSSFTTMTAMRDLNRRQQAQRMIRAPRVMRSKTRPGSSGSEDFANGQRPAAATIFRRASPSAIR